MRDYGEDTSRDSRDGVTGRLDAWCVIPVYNSAAAGVQVARECREIVDHVLVVDDGSTDADLRDLLRDDDIDVVRHPENRGKGRALLTALKQLAKRNAGHMITIDGDGQHLAADIPVMLEAIQEDNRALIIGCRDFNSPNVPGSSRFGRRFSNFWVRVETGRILNDTQSGYRAYPLEIVSRLRLHADRYDFEIEVLVRAIWAGASILERPVRVVYPPPRERISHFRPFLDNARLSRMHARLVGRRLLPWPHRRLVNPYGPEDVISFLRQPVRGLKRLLSENATPGGLAASAAVGSLLGVLPLVGCHMITIFYATARLHLNKVMALAIQNLYMPPVTPFLCIQVGFYLRNGRWWTQFTRAMIVDDFHQRLLDWLLGSLILAPVFAAVAGCVTFIAARAIQKRMHGEAREPA